MICTISVQNLNAKFFVYDATQKSKNLTKKIEKKNLANFTILRVCAVHYTQNHTFIIFVYPKI